MVAECDKKPDIGQQVYHRLDVDLCCGFLVAFKCLVATMTPSILAD